MNYDIWQTRRENASNKRIYDKKGNIAVNVWSDFSGAKPIVTMFVGKAKNPKYNYSFKCEFDAKRFIKNYSEYELKNINDRIDRQAEEKELKKNYKTSLKVGDVMHGSWGYDMTINEFYQIVEIKNQTVILQEIATERKAANFGYEDVKPSVNSFIGKPIKRLLQVYFYNGKPHEYIKLNEVCNLSKCENTNRYYYENHND